MFTDFSNNNSTTEYMMKLCFALSFFFLLGIGISFAFSSGVVFVAMTAGFILSGIAAYAFGAITIFKEFFDAKEV